MYNVVRKAGGANKGTVENFAYGESYSGRIAAMSHNGLSRFGSHTYTLILKTRFRKTYSESDTTRMKQVFKTEPQLTRAGPVRNFLSQAKIENSLKNVNYFAIQQSEDPG